MTAIDRVDSVEPTRDSSAQQLDVRTSQLASFSLAVQPLLLPALLPAARAGASLSSAQAGDLAGVGNSGAPTNEDGLAGGTSPSTTLLALGRIIGSILAGDQGTLAPVLLRAGDGGKETQAGARLIARRYLAEDLSSEDGSASHVADGAHAAVAEHQAGRDGAQPAAPTPVAPQSDLGPDAQAAIRIAVVWQEGVPPKEVDVHPADDDGGAGPNVPGGAARRVLRFEIDTGPSGRVGVVLASNGGSVSVVLAAESPAMAEALRQAGPELDSALAGAGLLIETMSIVETETASSRAALPAVI